MSNKMYKGSSLPVGYIALRLIRLVISLSLKTDLFCSFFQFEVMASSSCFLVLFLSLQVFRASTSILLLPLTHTLSQTNTTITNTRHLLKSSSTRTTARFKFLKQTHNHQHHQHHQNRQISLPLTAGSDYTLHVSLGSPPQTIKLYMDTGSDLVWLPCAPFECILCDLTAGAVDAAGGLPPFSSTGTAYVSCSAATCSSAHSNLPSSDLCTISGCPLETIETGSCSSFKCPPFYYAYGDGSLIAHLRSAHLSLSTPATHLSNFTFGCAHTTLAEPVGVAGFGRGVLSLPAQLGAVAPHLALRFSYCLAAHSFNSDRLRSPSPLILGRQDEPGFLYTPFLNNPKRPYFYCVGLDAVSIGNERLVSPERLRRVDKKGNGGMVVDSGTTFTTLPTEMQRRLAAEFNRQVDGRYKRAVEVEDETGLGPCYYVSNGAAGIPALVLHFAGNASVVLPRRNYFMTFLAGGEKRRSVGCLLVMGGGEEEEEGPAGILGNFQQQGFEVVYDLGKRRVGFARKRCSSLWDSLSNK